MKAELDPVKSQRRARRVDRRRKQILTAALTVFETVGFEAATTRAIAEAADFSEGTIYNYFPDKGELCIQALKEGSALATLVSLMEAHEGPLDEVFDHISNWRADNIERQSALLELLAEVLARPRLRNRYEEVIWEPAAQAIEAALAKRPRLGLPPPVAARVILASLLGLWLMSLADKTLRNFLETDADQMHKALLTLLEPRK